MTVSSIPAFSQRVIRVGKRLVVVGTVHVDPSSIQEAREIIRTVNPSVVAIELDQGRLNALIQEEASGSPNGGRRGSWSGLSVLLLSLLEKVAGQLTGSSPGREMLGAAEEAMKVGARVALIDMPIERTVGLLRRIPFREKLKLGLDSIASLIVLAFGFGTDTVSTGLEELMGNREDLTRNIGLFRKRYPNLSELLIDTREEYMAKSIGRILDGSTGTVVAVVGLGHMLSLSKRLESYSPTHETGQQGGYNLGSTWTIGT